METSALDGYDARYQEYRGRVRGYWDKLSFLKRHGFPLALGSNSFIVLTLAESVE